MAIFVAKTCDYIIEVLLYFLLIFSPLAYGSVQVLPLTIIESTSFLILSIWLVKQIFVPALNLIKASFWVPVILFISLVIFQLSPLPKEILGFLSPKHLYIFRTFVPGEALSQVKYYFTIYKEPTLFKLYELLSYISVFFVLLNTLETKKQFKRLILVIIAMGFLVSMIGIAKGFAYPFINKNHFAGYMEMTSFMAIGYLLTDLDKQKRIIFSFMAIVAILGLFLSLSRAGLLCFLFSLGLMLYLLKLRKGIHKKSRLILGIIIFTFLFMLIARIEPFLERVSTLFKKETISVDARWIIWKDSLRIIRDFPFFGTGLGTFKNIYPMYKTLVIQSSVFQAHSDFLQLISETGFLGFGLVFCFLYLFFKNIFKAWLSHHYLFAKGIALGGSCAAFSLFLHSFFDFNLQIPANALLITVVMSLSYKVVFLKENEVR